MKTFILTQKNKKECAGGISFIPMFISLFIALTFSNSFIQGQTTIEEYATGLVLPIGIEADSRGWLWVAEQGTGNNDSRISIITTDGTVHPFMEGIRSRNYNGSVIGIEHLYFDINGDLLLVGPKGTDSSSILIVDTSGFTPGDSALGAGDIKDDISIGDFVATLGGDRTSNPYTLTIGPKNDWFIVDAHFNGVIRRERNTGTLSVFKQWGNVAPTGIVFKGDKFYVGTLSPFPYAAGSAQIYVVDTSGNSSDYQTKLTTVMDLAIDPRDSNIIFIQMGRYNNGFVSNTGGVFKINNGVIDTIAYPMNSPSGLCFNQKGELFVSSFYGGTIHKITFTPTDVKINEDIPHSFKLFQNYPNPFNPATTISWQLPVSSHVSLKVYDILGNEVVTLVDEYKEAGFYETRFSAKGGSASGGDGSSLASGMYIYRIVAGNYVSTKKMLLIK